LFVGRVAENKRQSDIVDCFHVYRSKYEPRSKLLLPGAFASHSYQTEIRSKVCDLQLDDAVVLPGKISDADLVAYYQVADVFLCLSEHEGFGIPLIEAMTFGVPVVAHASASVPWTVGAGGLLLKTRDPEFVAAAVDMVVSNPGLRRAMRRGARRSIRRFEFETLKGELKQLLEAIGTDTKPVKPSCARKVARPDAPYWRVEGPFDSSYSLAIVNRNLAVALAQEGVPTGLWSTEGYGDFAPNEKFLRKNAAIATLVENGARPAGQDVTLRFCYPPRTEGMSGLVRAIHTYGWEETGFPQRYVDWFNQRLDLVTVLSKTVKKILMDAGVKVPIAVVGAGVDHLPGAKADAGARRSGSVFRFLHVSSCFPRKAHDVLLEAWAMAFTKDDPVQLVIKTFPNPHHDITADVNAIRTRCPDAADIEVINADLGEGALARLYDSADAYVGAARGEGFGMPLAEAMLHGLPVITTSWGGQTDFCDETTAWMVDFSFGYSSSHLMEGVSLWAEPNVRHLADRLREVLTAPEHLRRQRVESARARVASEFCWRHVAARTVRAVDALSSLPQLNPQLKVGWVTTWNSRCGIAEYSRYLVEAMADESAFILANRTDDLVGEEDQRLVRCWNSGQSGENLDEAYEHIRLRGLNAVFIQYNFGFFPLRVLASFIKRLRSQGIAVYCFFHSTTEFMHGDEWISLGSIRDELAQATRLFIHSVDDLNRLKSYGLTENSSLFLHGVRQPRVPRPPSGEAKVLACFGFLLPGKGLPQMIEAFASLAREDAGMRLKLVNSLYPASVSNEELERCIDQVRALGLESRVDFRTQFLTEDAVLDELAEARLVVYPYQATRESSSAAVRLGIASGRPIAVTPLSVFDDVRDAVFILPGIQPADLARGIDRLLRKANLEEESASRLTAWSEHRDWKRLGRRLRDIMQSCAINERFSASTGGWR
ncbi:MAG: glycosyltransferase, partial [Vicinamibacterales bacterium]